jgi:hypothetical protein
METYDKENHWYGHNGGERPVHPETEVICIDGGGKSYCGYAKEYVWTHNHTEDDSIIAFRIIKLYREPRKAREWWIPIIKGTQLTAAVHHGTDWSDENVDLVHVREVLPEDEA